MFPEVGGFPITGPPIKFSETPGSAGSKAPKLGEHTREVLSKLLGVNEDGIESLAAAGVIV
jgi:CoA:oxalate CoA-transferase